MRVAIAVLLGFVIMQVTPLLFGLGVAFVLPESSLEVLFGSVLIFGFASAVGAGRVAAVLCRNRADLGIRILILVTALSYIAWFLIASAPNPMWYRLGAGPMLIGGLLVGGVLLGRPPGRGVRGENMN